MVELILETIQGMPTWSYLAALTLLPLIGMPLSPLWVLVGVTFGIWNGLALICIAMAINFAIAFFIAKHWLREPISRFFQNRGICIPAARPGEHIKLTIAIRLMPVIPQFMQSYLLGLANVSFPVYYFFSFPTQIAYAIGFLVLGESLFSMKFGGIILGLCILIAITLVLSIVRGRRVSEISSDGHSA